MITYRKVFAKQSIFAKGKWESGQNLIFNAGLIQNKEPVTNAFTNEFIDKVYNNV